MSNIVLAQATKLAGVFGMELDPQELVTTLKATAFKGQVSESQMAALLIVANQYGLNPWTKEIYAFPDKNNGIVPVVGIDGWSRIINSNAQFDGMDFEQDADSCTCIIYRKDRSHPIKVTEWMDECRRNAGPWQSHPKRMLRHKAMIQCARIAFGFVGIYDQDEAERVVESNSPKQINPETGKVTPILFDVAAALAAVECCVSLESLEMMWKLHGGKAVAAKDKEGHVSLKAAVIAKKAALEAEAEQGNVVEAEAA